MRRRECRYGRMIATVAWAHNISRGSPDARQLVGYATISFGDALTSQAFEHRRMLELVVQILEPGAISCAPVPHGELIYNKMDEQSQFWLESRSIRSLRENSLRYDIWKENNA